jgi:DNA invertase Pin-like site-specific DNA recombinase
MTMGMDRRSATGNLGSGLNGVAVGYARVSTKRQGEKGSSLEAQRAAIQAYSDAMGYTLIEIFEDVSSGVGAKSFHNRKRLQSALDLADHNDAVLIVWDWDRLSRHAGFERQVQKVLPDAKRIICAKDGMNMLEASRAARFKHGEHAAANISRATKEALAKKKAQGVTFGNPAIATEVQPLGTESWSNTRKDHDQTLADVLRRLPNPMEITREQAAEVFNQNGLLTLHKKEWTKSRVTEPLKRARELLRSEDQERMTTNPIYGMF